MEEIRPIKRALRENVERTIAIPVAVESEEKSFFVPVMIVRKGELQDDLKVTLGNGAPAHLLNYSEYLILVAHALHFSFISAVIDESVAPLVQAIEEDAVELIAQRGKELKDPQDCLDRIKALAEHADEPRHLWAVAELVKALARHYPIVAVVPRPENSQTRAIIKYERLVIPQLKAVPYGQNKLRYLRDQVGRAVGTKPIELDLTLNNASFAQSYHILVFGPEGTYLGFQDVPEVRETIGESAYFRFRRRLGQAYAHGYFRSVPPDAGANLRLTARFFEIPPGTIAKASVAAFANLLLMFSAAVLLGADQVAVANAFPVLVLTIPAAISAWIGLDSAGQQLLDGTLSSRLSSMFTVGASLASSVLYMAQVSGMWQFRQDAVNLFGVRDTAWQILVFGSFMNCLWTTYLWIGRSVSYYVLADRQVETPQAVSN
ncbi:hypothetical protein SAMN05661093_03350 [Kibdelosporangium aridum]|uniref:Uncharacterized protein n=1 Tax=Kibdelosporangium aridum TaxID=2030 RepID=A0A1Y5XLH3_KIBAR|nr:hypothetical protein SAMN05661093_03350 [Kibdelosporangium aridum]